MSRIRVIAIKSLSLTIWVIVAVLVLPFQGWSAPPAKETLELSNVMQNWDKNLPSSTRFTILASFNNEAVRDNNTGLVWERNPVAPFFSWSAATGQCLSRTVGGTTGWRLPSIVELLSVRDPSLPAPYVPGSVFTGVQLSTYWTATTAADDATFAWNYDFLTNSIPAGLKTGSGHVWCVRGNMSADTY